MDVASELPVPAIIPQSLLEAGARLFVPFAAGLLRWELRKDRPLVEWVDFAFRFHDRFHFRRWVPRGFSIAPIQKASEISALLEIVHQLRPRKVLEIGAASGGTLFLFARASAPDATLVSIDLPESAGGYHRWRERLYRSFKATGQRIHLVRADSHSQECRRLADELAEPGGFDFLFIDGDHSYEGVVKDFEYFRPLVRPGGIVGFHDIVMDYKTRYGIESPVSTGGVPLFWEELRNQYPVLEIIENPEQDGFGIGVIKVPRSPQ